MPLAIGMRELYAATSSNYSPVRAYGAAVLENILFTKELDRRYHSRGISTAAFHPGNVATTFGTQSESRLMKFITTNRITRAMLTTPEKEVPTSWSGSPRVGRAPPGNPAPTTRRASPPSGSVRRRSTPNSPANCGTASKNCWRKRPTAAVSSASSRRAGSRRASPSSHREVQPYLTGPRRRRSRSTALPRCPWVTRGAAGVRA